MNRFFQFFSKILMAILVSTSLHVYASNDIPISFKDYIPIELGNKESYENGTVYLAPDLSNNVSKVKSSDENYFSSIDITSPSKSTFKITFDPGPSHDPSFFIQVNNSKESSEVAGGDILFVSSRETFYLTSKSNEFYEKARKYHVVGDQIIEVAQPFYYLGRECKTSTTLFMYTEKCNKGEKVATLPMDSKVKVLLAEYRGSKCVNLNVADNDIGDPIMQFLVATPFGLVGWVSSTGGHLYRPGKPLSCIRYFGD